MNKIFTYLRKKIVLVLVILSLSVSTSKAQSFFPVEDFNPGSIYPVNLLGRLFNSQPYLLKNTPVLYYLDQDSIYVSAYLPRIIYEYNVNKPISLFGPDYTTGIALASPKNEALRLFAPVQIAVRDISSDLRPFAAIIPYSPDMSNYTGPFDQLPDLNGLPGNYTSPTPGISGLSAMAITQDFTKFTHDFFKWNGTDKLGNNTINVEVVPEVGIGRIGEYVQAQNKLMIFKTEENDLAVSKTLMGHELTHGIVNNIVGYNPYAESLSKKELNEGFGDIVGSAFANWKDFKTFVNPSWTIQVEFKNPLVDEPPFKMNDPKSYGYPSTYMGEHYASPNDPDYKYHTNGYVLEYLFYLLSFEGEGLIDGNMAKPFVQTPLVPEDGDASYKLAIKTLFKTFTEKLSPTATYIDTYKASLEALISPEHPKNSTAYLSMKNAWHIVGIGEKPDIYNPICSVPRSAKTQYNGLINFTATAFNLESDPNSDKAYTLSDCSQGLEQKTLQYYTPLQKTVNAWDTEPDSIFSYTNNTDQSKSAVSVFAFSQIAQAWFDYKFDYHGPDGQAEKPLINILGHPSYVHPAFDKNTFTYYYPYAPEAASRDEISMNYFRGINYFLKQDNNVEQDLLNPEWEAIRNGIAQIFALTIKNDYTALLPQPETPVWTLNEDIETPGYLLNFEISALNKSARLYHGNNWSNTTPAKNASMVRLWYYLIMHGTDGAQGYTNEKGHTYFIYPIQQEIAINLVWNAYKNYMPIFGTFEDFRLATLQALKDKGYGENSKEYIALYDSWAAVMDMPNHGANLKHEPLDGESIDPWSAKIGVEVEYPQYESARVFEVSTSPKFKDVVAPVYRFFSYVAPNLISGMTYGRVNLEPNETYYVHSHLYKSGGNTARAGASCDDSEDPVFCRSLEGKENWTPTYSFKTSEKVVKALKPSTGTEVAAWETPFSWAATLGADGYQMMVTDQTGKVKPQTINIDQTYDPESPTTETKLALSANTKYTWTLSPRVRLGSPEGVKAILLPEIDYTLYEPLTADEKKIFPYVYTYGSTTNPIVFKTNLPKVVLESPTDNTKLSMVDQKVYTKALGSTLGADFFTWTFFYNGDNQNPKHSEDYTDPAVTMPHITNLPYFEDKHVYSWTFTPKKSATAPFIPVEESGAPATPFHFSVNAALIPKPIPIDENCRPNKFEEILKWNTVPGAQGYRYTLVNKTSNQIVKIDSVENLTQSTPITGSNTLAKYGWKVSAGVINVNGKWIWGPESAESSYLVRPESPKNLKPNNNETVTFGNNKSVKFSWDMVPGVTNYHFHLNKIGGIDVKNEDVGNMTEFQVSNLDYGQTYTWTVEAINPADPNHVSICHATSSEATFTCPPEPKKVIPELGFNLSLLDCNDLGVCLPDIKYTVTVTDPNGSMAFNKSGLLSNIGGIPPIVGNPIVYPFLNQPYTVDGNLHKPISGLYKVVTILTVIGAEAAPETTIVFDARVLDIWNPLHNQGNAVQLELSPNTKTILTTLNAIITIKFKYDASTNNIVIQ